MSQRSLLDLLQQPREPLSVSELTARVKLIIEGQFMDVWVEGEISNFRRHSSGHWYFTLKDEGAMLRAASFRMQNRLIRFTPEDGMLVRARGRLSLYEARGEYQIIVEALEPVGIGALQLAFEQLKRRLAREGLFDAERKRPLPLVPRRIGVVTSPTGAAIRDILRVLKRRNPSVSVLLAPAAVQGDGAAEEIAAAIDALNRIEEIDVIIVGRGGGSIEDLWSFNEEPVARAIFASRVPVISAVGHETDFTIADFVADLRASTPSAAAELATAARDDLQATLRGLTESLAGELRYRLLAERNRLSELVSSPAFDALPNRLRSAAQRVDQAVYAMESALRRQVREARRAHQDAAAQLRAADIRQQLARRRGALDLLGARLEVAARRALERRGETFAIAAGKLAALSPLAVLARGYAIAFDARGRIVKRAADVAPGERLRLRLADGEIDCVREGRRGGIRE